MKLESNIILKQHQEESIDFVKNHRDCVLTLKMGLGKTLTSLEYISRELQQEKKTFLVVLNKTLILSWISEIEKFYKTSPPKYFVLHNDFNKVKDVDAEKLKEYDIVFATYSSISRAFKGKNYNYSEHYFVKTEQNNKIKIVPHTNIVFTRTNTKGFRSVYGLKWDGIFCDEIHCATNWKTGTFKGLYCLSRKKTIGLTGTLIRNKKEELMGAFTLMRKYQHFLEFPNKWKSAKPHTFGKDPFEIFKIVDYEIANIKMPKTEEHIEYLKPTKEQVQKMMDVKDKYKDSCFFSNKNNNKDIDNLLALVIINYFRMANLCSSIVDLDKNTGKEKEVFDNPKSKRILEIVKEKKQKGEKTIVFSSYTLFLTELKLYLESQGIKVSMIESKFSINKRVSVLDEFKNENEVLLLNYKIGSEGLNLQYANNVIIADTYWNFAIEEQAICRTKRVGQEKKVYIYRLMMRKTIDDFIYEKCQAKKDLLIRMKAGEDIDFKRIYLDALYQQIRELSKQHKINNDLL
jgi:SNF2 family DNA or RNA helicase